jgi:hypothetical protein
MISSYILSNFSNILSQILKTNVSKFELKHNRSFEKYYDNDI